MSPSRWFLGGRWGKSEKNDFPQFLIRSIQEDEMMEAAFIWVSQRVSNTAADAAKARYKKYIDFMDYFPVFSHLASPDCPGGGSPEAPEGRRMRTVNTAALPPEHGSMATGLGAPWGQKTRVGGGGYNLRVRNRQSVLIRFDLAQQSHRSVSSSDTRLVRLANIHLMTFFFFYSLYFKLVWLPWQKHFFWDKTEEQKKKNEEKEDEDVDKELPAGEAGLLLKRDKEFPSRHVWDV